MSDNAPIPQLWNFEEIQVGMSAHFSESISQDKLEVFAQISGDFNPLHLDDEYARSLGHPSAVLHGVLTTSLYSKLCGMYLPGRKCLMHLMRVNFRNPAYVDELLIVRGQVASITSPYKTILIKASIAKQCGTIVSDSNIQVGVI